MCARWSTPVAGDASGPEGQRGPTAALAAEESPRELRRAGLTILGSLSFSSGDYAEAARLGGALEQLLTQAGNTEAAGQTAMTRRVAELLAAEPGQRMERPLTSGRSAARRDVAGLMRVDITVNGAAQDAVFDTGANLSVLSASTAQRLGVRMLEGSANVGNSVRSTVPVRLGIADRLEIGGNMLRNVAFLIIDDAALSFGPGRAYKIPAIIGYPVMQPLRRLRLETDALIVEPRGAASGAPNLTVTGNEMFVDAKGGGVEVPLCLDTGANPSHLNPLFVEAHPEPFAGLTAEERQRAGAGRRTSDRAVRWQDVAIAIAGRWVQVPSLVVGVPGGEAKPSPRYGVIGADLLGRFASYTIDFKAMRLDLGEPVPAAAPPPRPGTPGGS